MKVRVQETLLEVLAKIDRPGTFCTSGQLPPTLPGLEVAGVGRAEARSVIDAAGGSVRTAIVMAARGVSREGAEALLAAHDNHLRPILGDPPPVAGA